MRRSQQIVSLFLLQFCKFYVNWGKNMHTFDQLGKIYAFPPTFLHPLSICYLPYFCIGSNRKIYTPVCKPVGNLLLDGSLKKSFEAFSREQLRMRTLTHWLTDSSVRLMLLYHCKLVPGFDFFFKYEVHSIKNSNLSIKYE